MLTCNNLLIGMLFVYIQGGFINLDKDLCINPPRVSLKALIQRGSMLFMVFQNIS